MSQQLPFYCRVRTELANESDDKQTSDQHRKALYNHYRYGLWIEITLGLIFKQATHFVKPEN